MASNVPDFSENEECFFPGYNFLDNPILMHHSYLGMKSINNSDTAFHNCIMQHIFIFLTKSMTITIFFCPGLIHYWCRSGQTSCTITELLIG